MDRAQGTMKAELEDALGERVSDDEARWAVERAPASRAAWLRSNRLLILIAAAVAVAVGAALSIALGSVWFTVFALLVHFLVTLAVATLAIKLLAEVEKPDPVTVARLEAAGVDDPEQRLNMAIRSHGVAADGLTEDAGTARNRPAAQAESMTPSSDDTELAGPGSPETLRDSA